MRVTPQQIEAVLKLPGPKRYEFFVKKVADWQEAWGLYDDGWALLGAEDGKGAFPLWPAKEYATACATGDWAAYQPRAIPLAELTGELLPKLEEEGLLPAVFPTPGGKSVTPDVKQLIADLAAEARRYEE